MPTQRQNLRTAVVTKRGRSCAYCGAGPLHRHALHLDAINPANGDAPSNLVPCCAHCKQRKGDQTASAYVASRLPELTRELDIMRVLAARFT
jgi:5-methylcytosine-specific restriction endonuclease McrA